MLEKLSYIFTVLFLGIFFSVLFSIPAAKIQAVLKEKMVFFSKHKKAARVLSILGCYLLLFLLLFFVLSIFYYNLYQYFCGVSWEEFSEKIVNTGQSMMNLLPFLDNPEMRNRCTDLFFSAMEMGMEKIVRFFVAILVKLPKILIQIGLGIVISVYLLIDKENYIDWIRSMKDLWRFHNKTGKCDLQKNDDTVWYKIISEAKKSFFGYWKGQALDALIMGTAISVGLYFIGVPLGASIGILAGIGNLIPYIGPVIAYVFTAFFCVIEGKMKTLVLAVIYLLVVQQIDGSYIGPKLLGKHVDVKPLTVVISVLVGGTLFGAFGMILAVPTVGIAKSVIEVLKD